MTATVLAVTGSNGKTTVKRMIHHILSGRKKGSASPRSFNNNIGVPLTLLAAEAADEYVVCELGSNAPGEIAALAAIAQPDVAVIASVGPTHLEKLIDLEHVALEKASILGGLREGGLGIIWADSPALAQAVKAYPVRLVRFGADERADLRLTNYQPDSGGGRYEINQRRWHRLGVPGRHMACNALAAIAAAGKLGIDQETSALALESYRSQDMRLQEIHLGGLTLINDAYNANPASMQAAGESLASFAGTRRVLVAGDMRELGPSAEQLHRDTGKALARCGLNLLVGVGTLGALIAQGAAGYNGLLTQCFAGLDEAAAALPGLLRAGDVVLIKGSRGMAMERLIEPLRRAFADKAQEPA
jgi:UDP-N-acetylmuramoyl-tripeptide--D-alanyl-D-alanine ligase